MTEMVLVDSGMLAELLMEVKSIKEDNQILRSMVIDIKNSTTFVKSVYTTPLPEKTKKKRTVSKEEKLIEIKRKLLRR